MLSFRIYRGTDETLKTELLLDRFVLVCSDLILGTIDLNNACFMLADATHFNSFPLIERVQEYMAANLECLLECRILDVLEPFLLKQVSAFIRNKQAKKSPVTRSYSFVDRAMGLYGDWLALQDISVPIIRTAAPKLSPTMSPPRSAYVPKRRPSRQLDVTSSSQILPTPIERKDVDTEDIFAMDDVEVGTPTRQPPAWKAISTPPRYVCSVSVRTLATDD